MNNYTEYTSDDLTVAVDWGNASAQVWFHYDDGPCHAAPYQTADFDVADPSAMLRTIGAYAEELCQ